MITNIKNFYRNFSSKSKWHERFAYYAVYSLVFGFTFLCAYHVFLNPLKSFVWDADAYTQHLPILTYWGQYLREAAVNLFSGNGLSLPQWEMNMGAGDDVITTLSFYIIGDPFGYLSAFVPSSYTPYLYSVLVVLRLFCIGIAFSAFCKRFNCGRFASLCSSIIYVFCGFSLYAGIRHPFFLNPLIFLPLILIGVEKILAKEKPFFFIITVALSCASSYYFFYMLVVLTVIYVVIRVLTMHKQRKIFNLLIVAKNLILYGIISLFLAAPIVLPSIMVMFGTERFGTNAYVETFYTTAYYRNLYLGLGGNVTGTIFSSLGFGCAATASIFLLFAQRKKCLGLKIGVILLTLILIIPYGGYVMSGFDYVINRWSFGFAFLVSFITALMMPKLIAPSKKSALVLVCCSVAYILGMLCLPLSGTKNKFASPAMFLLFVIVVLFFYITDTSKVNDTLNLAKTKIKVTSLKRVIALILIIVSISLNAEQFFSPAGTNYAAGYESFWKTRSMVTDTVAAAGAKIDDDSYFRIDTDVRPSKNFAMVYDVNSTYSYFSLSNPYYSEFVRDVMLPANPTCNIHNLNRRADLAALFSAKYFVAENETSTPYGYNKTLPIDSKYTISQTDNALPFGWTYSSYITQDDYQKLNFMQKQQAMLQGAVLSDMQTDEAQTFGKDNSINTTEASFSMEEIPFTVSGEEGISINNKTITVKNKNAKLTFTFASLQNCETYIQLQGLNFTKDPSITADTFAVSITAETSAVIDSQAFNTKEHNYYDGKHDFLFNLGYSQQAQTTATLNFNQKGTYNFGELKMYCENMQNLPAATAKLKEDSLQNVLFGNDYISGDITLQEPKILSLALPYTTGWTAYVDSEPVDTIRINTMFTGIALQPGNHKIELRYSTPWLSSGLMLFGAGVLVLIALLLYYRFFKYTVAIGFQKKPKRKK
ncbi:MAG: YfhO family protein [Oscillospiraceae bacterium]|jgi:uncharacterized membrane protein YfhO|nr:YfhO family protein [Oscillospiraceae bacterium]